VHGYPPPLSCLGLLGDGCIAHSVNAVSIDYFATNQMAKSCRCQKGEFLAIGSLELIKYAITGGLIASVLRQ